VDQRVGGSPQAFPPRAAVLCEAERAVPVFARFQAGVRKGHAGEVGCKVGENLRAGDRRLAVGPPGLMPAWGRHTIAEASRSTVLRTGVGPWGADPGAAQPPHRGDGGGEGAARPDPGLGESVRARCALQSCPQAADRPAAAGGCSIAPARPAGRGGECLACWTRATHSGGGGAVTPGGWVAGGAVARGGSGACVSRPQRDSAASGVGCSGTSAHAGGGPPSRARRPGPRGASQRSTRCGRGPCGGGAGCI
jgi:hypothetical protein